MGAHAHPDPGVDQLEQPFGAGGDGLGRDHQALVAKGPIRRLPEWAAVTADEGFLGELRQRHELQGGKPVRLRQDREQPVLAQRVVV